MTPPQAPQPETASPEAPPPRKPRSFAILWGLVTVLAIAWSVWWFVAASQVDDGLDRAAEDLRKAGYEVSWSSKKVEGWPFRTLIRFKDFRLVAPTGHAVMAPQMNAQANTYDLGKWVAVAPEGLTIVRGEKGAVDIKAEAIRASISQVNRSPARFGISLRRAIFKARPDAEPFPLAAADLVDFYLEPREGPKGTGALMFRVEKATPRPDGMLDWIGNGAPFSMRAEALLTEFHRFQGGAWGPSVRAWTAAGGRLNAVNIEAETGPTKAGGSADTLWVGPDGRLRGSFDLSLTGGPKSLMALARTGEVSGVGATAAAATAVAAGGLEGTAKVKVRFADEGTMFGPVRLTGSPKVF